MLVILTMKNVVCIIGRGGIVLLFSRGYLAMICTTTECVTWSVLASTACTMGLIVHSPQTDAIHSTTRTVKRNTEMGYVIASVKLRNVTGTVWTASLRWNMITLEGLWC